MNQTFLIHPGFNILLNRHCSVNGNNQCWWSFGLLPTTLTSWPLHFLCFYSASTIIGEGKAHCCILSDSCLKPEHSWGLCIGTEVFARVDTAVFTPCQYTCPVQPARPTCPVQFVCYVRSYTPVVKPHAWQAMPSSRLTPLATDWTQGPTLVCCHFATNSVWILWLI